MLKNVCNINAILRLAINSKKVNIKFRYTNSGYMYVNFLYRNGYIRGFSLFKNKEGFDFIIVFLKYYLGKSVIKRIERYSKPSKKIHMSYFEIQKKFNYPGLLVVSTNTGIPLLNYKDIMLNKVGGLVICNLF